MLVIYFIKVFYFYHFILFITSTVAIFQTGTKITHKNGITKKINIVIIEPKDTYGVNSYDISKFEYPKNIFIKNGAFTKNT